MIVHPPGYEIGLAIADLMQNKVIKKTNLKIAYSLFSPNNNIFKETICFLSLINAIKRLFLGGGSLIFLLLNNI